MGSNPTLSAIVTCRKRPLRLHRPKILLFCASFRAGDFQGAGQIALRGCWRTEFSPEPSYRLRWYRTQLSNSANGSGPSYFESFSLTGTKLSPKLEFARSISAVLATHARRPASDSNRKFGFDHRAVVDASGSICEHSDERKLTCKSAARSAAVRTILPFCLLNSSRAFYARR